MIMDGNKRWADLHGASLKEGYQKGLNKLREIISVCLEQEIKYLTVYALSAENMKRVSVPIIFTNLERARGQPYRTGTDKSWL